MACQEVDTDLSPVWSWCSACAEILPSLHTAKINVYRNFRNSTSTPGCGDWESGFWTFPLGGSIEPLQRSMLTDLDLPGKRPESQLDDFLQFRW